MREAALRAEHAAEVARLTVALRSMRAAHAAEIERLRAEHAAGLRRSVEADRQTRDAARAGANGGGPGWRSALEAVARLLDLPPGTRDWLARITGRG